MSRLKWLVAGTMIGLAALVGVRLWMIEGLLLRRVSIDGPSMAPAFYGAHYLVNCGDCGFPFRCDAANVPASGLVVCPNCGFAKNELLAANLRPEEEVLVDRWPVLIGQPQRGQTVAARLPQALDEMVIKRVAGLPGEKLEIRGGDLFVGDSIVRKSLREFRASRVLVHDNDFQPQITADLPPRWMPAQANSPWQAHGTGFKARITKAAGAKGFDWLEYYPWRCAQSAARRTAPVPILDNDSFNQNLSRQLNPVPDVMLTCRIQATGKGALALATFHGLRRYGAIISPASGRVFSTSDRATIAEQPVKADFSRPVLIEFGLVDRQIVLAIDGRIVFVHWCGVESGSPSDVLHPLAIGASNLAVEVSHLQVWRDIYYLEPLGTPRPWQAAAPLAPDEFALLGDNPPVSIDSRHWPGTGGAAGTTILGRVVRPFWAVR